MSQRCRQRAALVETQRFVKAFELQLRVREIRGVRVREVREDAFDIHVARFQRRFEQPLGAVPVRADALHARIDLEMHARLHTPRGGDFVDREKLVDRRRGERHVVLEKLRDLRADDAAEHEHRRANAGFAQPQRLFQIGHRDSANGCTLSSICPTATSPCPYAFAFNTGMTRAGATCFCDHLVIGAQAGEIHLQVRGPQLCGARND